MLRVAQANIIVIHLAVAMVELAPGRNEDPGVSTEVVVSVGAILVVGSGEGDGAEGCGTQGDSGAGLAGASEDGKASQAASKTLNY